MPLEVIGAGFGRTGTMSLYHALNELGYPCYHMAEVFKDLRQGNHLRFWHSVAEAPAGTQHDWETVFADMRATVDFPAASVWRELLAAYPDAKVLLSMHPKGADAWYESAWETIYYGERYWQFDLVKRLTTTGRLFGEMTGKLIWNRALQGAMPDRAKAVERYEQHLAEVKAAVPPERLLVYTVTEGWEPLCDFLGVPVPATPFPNVNERAQFKRMIAVLRYGVIGALLATAVALAALVTYLF